MTAPKKPQRPGRQPRSGKASDKLLRVRCTEEELNRWNAAAREQGVNLADVVRRYLERWSRDKVG